MSFLNFDINLTNTDFIKYSVNFELDNNSVFECKTIS